MSIRKIAIRAFFWSLLQQFSSQIVGFIISVILTRILSPSDYGIIGMISIFVSLGTLLIESGMGQSLIRTKILTETDYNTVFYFNLIISIFLYFLIFFLSKYIAIFTHYQF